MLTICWAAKGGSGTSVVAASMALASPSPSLFVDLAGDGPRLLGLPTPDTPGFFNWLESNTPIERLGALETELDATTGFIHRGTPHDDDRQPDRWNRLVGAWVADRRQVVVDAGTLPARSIIGSLTNTVLVTRACYLAVSTAIDYGVRPSRIVLVHEPGRAMRPADIERSLGAPIVATIEWDPAIARAVDSGLLAARLPAGLRRELRDAA